MSISKLLSCGVIAAYTGALWATGEFDSALLHGDTDKARAIDYAPGETMAFTLSFQNVKGPLPPDTYFVRWQRDGDDGKTESGNVPAEQVLAKPLVVKTSLAKPGFVRIRATVHDKAGKRVGKLFFDGGAGVQTDRLHGNVPEPKDFDAFWNRQRERLAKVPVKARRIELPSPKPSVRLFAIEIDCAGVRPVTGYLSIPKAAESGKKFPCLLNVDGYSYKKELANPPRWVFEDRVRLGINAHGMKLPAFGADDGYYKAFGWEIGSHDMSYAFDPKQNADAEVAYFNGMALRVMRGLEYLRSLPEWNGKDLWAEGGSQGGLQTVWAASLDPKVTEARPGIPWCCDLGGKDLDGRHADSWRIHYTPALGYYDPINLCKRIPRTCHVIITRAGLGDYCCPPSGVMALYNNMTCPKTAYWHQGSTHGYVPPEKHAQFTLEAK